MKKLTIILFLLSTVVTSSYAANFKSYKDYKNLDKYLNILSNVAKFGGSLAMFDYTESYMDTDKCQNNISAENAFIVFERATDSILEGGDCSEINMPMDTFYELEKKAHNDFRKILGNEKYKICTGSTGGYMGIGFLTQIRNKNYRFGWELGYED